MMVMAVIVVMMIMMMGVASVGRRGDRGEGNSRCQQQRRENFLHHFSSLRESPSPRLELQTNGMLGQPT
jgi:hypothetical protein